MSSNEESDIEIVTRLLENAEKDSVEKTKTCSKSDNQLFLEDVDFESQIIKKGHVFKNHLDSKLVNNDSQLQSECSNILHSGDTDSSDDEEKRNHNFKYSQSGKEIKNLITDEKKYTKDIFCDKSTWKTKQSNLNKSEVKKQEICHKNLLTPYSSSEVQTKNVEAYIDPTFGIRIINPLISQFQIKEKMVGRKNITLSQVEYFLSQENKDVDWVIAGVIVSKSNTKVSKNGNKYLMWIISDLKNDLKTVTVFLFRAALKTLWKVSKGTVVAILNPGVLEKRDGCKEQASLSIDNSERVLILGQSKDLGVCKSKKLNGEPCTAFVNVNNCEYCIYHIKQEYKRMSMRSELQSSCAGRGLNALRNKVLGKNEVFYAGKSYMAIPAKKNKKLVEKDASILNSLSKKSFYSESKSQNKTVSGTSVNKQNARHLEVSVKQRLKDIELLKKLGGTDILSEAFSSEVSNQKVKCDIVQSAVITSEICKKNVSGILAKLKKLKTEGSTIQKRIPTECSTKPVISEEEYNSSPLFISKSSPLKNSELKPTQMIDNEHLKLNNLNRKSINDKAESDFTPIREQSQKIKEKENLSNKKDLSHESNVENTFLNKSLSETDLKVVSTSSQNMHSNENLEKKKMLQTNNFPEKKNNKSICENIDAFPSQNMKTKKDLDFANITKTNSNSSMSSLNVPSLNKGSSSIIDLNIPLNRKIMNHGRIKALNWVAKNGPITKEDPSNTKSRGVKRLRPDLFENSNSEIQKSEEMTVKSKKFKEIMEAKSAHAELIDFHEQCVQENYFNKLEKIEKMEEKMMSTFKIECKAVRCLKCKYTNFSASELCKVERHPLKVFDTFKRFFLCSDCKNRIVTLDMIPLVACKKCGGNKWERTSMMKEKIANINLQLSLRGDEEQFINSFTTSSNLNLLVPE